MAIIWLRFRRFMHRNKAAILLTVVFIAIFGFVVIWGIKEMPGVVNKIQEPKIDPAIISEDIFQAIIEGDYQNAMYYLRDELNEDPDNEELSNLWTQLTDEFQIDVKFDYFIDQRKYKTTKELTPDIILTSRDPYYMTVNPSHTCYLYVFQVDSKGNINIIHPNREYSPSDNPILPGPLKVPHGSKWFFLDETKGMETIYLVATRFENRRLANLTTKPALSEAVGQELILYLKTLGTMNVPAVVFKKYQFIHE